MQGNLSGIEKQRQNYIQELITTEESYNADMSIVIEVNLKISVYVCIYFR